MFCGRSLSFSLSSLSLSLSHLQNVFKRVCLCSSKELIGTTGDLSFDELVINLSLFLSRLVLLIYICITNIKLGISLQVYFLFCCVSLFCHKLL